MKIAITGAHGTGKTTLAKRAAQELNFDLLSEAAFEAYKAGFALNERTTLAAEKWILHRQLEKETSAKDNWVTDRCLIDTLAYTNYFFPLEQDALGAMTELAMPNIRAYDLVIYLPAGQFLLENDGLRSIDDAFQNVVDVQIRHLMDFHNIRYVELTGSIDERIEKLRQRITEFSSR